MRQVGSACDSWASSASRLSLARRAGIVTNSKQDHFALIHQTTGLLTYFHFVLTASDYMHSKPHPEPYLMAVKRSGFRKEECLVIDPVRYPPKTPA
jgi:HAD superfamily hydrolase (TIGR01509 family)